MAIKACDLGRDRPVPDTVRRKHRTRSSAAKATRRSVRGYRNVPVRARLEWTRACTLLSSSGRPRSRNFRTAWPLRSRALAPGQANDLHVATPAVARAGRPLSPNAGSLAKDGFGVGGRGSSGRALAFTILRAKAGTAPLAARLFHHLVCVG